jgi:hypothetical protein
MIASFALGFPIERYSESTKDLEVLLRDNGPMRVEKPHHNDATDRTISGAVIRVEALSYNNPS